MQLQNYNVKTVSGPADYKPTQIPKQQKRKAQLTAIVRVRVDLGLCPLAAEAAAAGHVGEYWGKVAQRNSSSITAEIQAHTRNPGTVGEILQKISCILVYFN